MNCEVELENLIKRRQILTNSAKTGAAVLVLVLVRAPLIAPRRASAAVTTSHVGWGGRAGDAQIVGTLARVLKEIT
ncbi:hypothetical protein IF803_39780 [Bradyrhizobium sp. UFLA06-06]